MNIVSNGFPSIEQVTDQYLQKKTTNISKNNGQSFTEIFKQKQINADNNISTNIESVKFSKHASNRLSDRNIELSVNQIDRLNAGTQMASKKGINESLVLIDELAFIVNTKNNTVITAMTQNSSEDNVFTNIDGAVIA